MPFQRFTCTPSVLRVNAVGQQLGKLAQLAACQAHVHADAHVRLQLRFDAGQRGQHPDGGKLAALPVQVVALENVSEEMRLLTCPVSSVQ